MARQVERCVGELTWTGNGRQIGDRCLRTSSKWENHRCRQHCDQHDNPRYPTCNSYLRRSDERRVPNSSQIEAQRDMLRTGASTPVDTPSRTTASAERSHSNTPQQQSTSSSPRPQTSPEQPHCRRPATSESPRTTPLYTNTPTQALSAISAPNRSLGSNTVPTSPATENQTPSEQHNRQRNVTPHPPGRIPSQTPTPTQASLPPPSANVRKLANVKIIALYNQPPDPASPAINGTLRPSGRLQNGTPAPNPSHLTSRPNHDDTSRTTSSTSEDSDRNYHHTPRPPTPTPRNQAGLSSQSSDSASLRTRIRTSTNTPTPTPTSSYRSDRSNLLDIEENLYRILTRLQRAGECPSVEPLGQDWIEIEPTSVPSIPSSIPEPEGRPPSIIDIIADVVYEYMESGSPGEYPEEYAMRLLRQGCDESERGKRFRRWLRRRGVKTRGE